MTGLGVERSPRAAYPSVSADASAPMPPHIQGAERQRSRWAMRLLVVGGLAGAAWLLTGAAAHAADRADGPDGSLLGSVVDGDALPVTGLLTAAAQPLEAVPAHKHHVVADILEVPQRVLTRPVETVSEITHDGTGTTVDAAAGGIDTVLREVAGPLRLTGGPRTTQRQIIAVVTDPVATPDARPVAEQPEQPAVAPLRATTPETPAAPMISPHLDRPLRAPIAGAVRAGVVVRHLKAASHRIAHRHRVVRPTAVDDATASEDSPGGDGPAPLQLHLGDVSGTSTSGSGTPTEGGSAAFVPAAITSNTMACHRLPIVSDVEVRRIHAEAPTVSPD